VEKTRVARKTFEIMQDGRRKMGRLRMRWLEDGENNLRELKGKRSRQKANNTEE
jgi:hypothetical protein